MARTHVENLHKGEAGENRVTLLLQNLGFCVAQPRPDRFGTDLLGYQWLQEPELRDITFYFQVKEHDWESHSDFPVSAKFLEIAFENPAILFVTGGSDAFANRYRACPVFDWILDNPLWKHKKQDEFRIKKALFQEIGDLPHARQLLLAEAYRTSGRYTTRILRGYPPERSGMPLWTPNRTPSLFLEQSDLFTHFGSLGVMEPPHSVIEAVRQATEARTDDMLLLPVKVLRESKLDELADEISSNPSVAEWLSRVKENVPSRRVKEEALEFSRFVSAMRSMNRGEPFRMPGYTWREISAWRVFADVYPGGIDLLKKVLIPSA